MGTMERTPDEARNLVKLESDAGEPPETRQKPNHSTTAPQDGEPPETRQKPGTSAPKDVVSKSVVSTSRGGGDKRDPRDETRRAEIRRAANKLRQAAMGEFFSLARQNQPVNYSMLLSKRRGSEVFAADSGHIYMTSNHSYLQCCLSKWKGLMCPGTAKIGIDNYLVERQEHNHDTNHKDIRTRHLVNKLRDTVANDNSGRTVRQIFQDVVKSSPVGRLVKFDSLRITLQRDWLSRGQISMPLRRLAPRHNPLATATPPAHPATLPDHPATPLTSATPPDQSATPLTSATPPDHPATPLTSATPPDHPTTPLTSATPPDHPTTLLTSATPLDHPTTPMTSATPPDHLKISLTSATPPDHLATPLTSATPPDHRATPLTSATPPDHRAIPLESAILPDHLATPLASAILPDHRVTPGFASTGTAHQFGERRRVATRDRSITLLRRQSRKPSQAPIPGPLSSATPAGQLATYGLASTDTAQHRSLICSSPLTKRRRVESEFTTIPKHPEHCARLMKGASLEYCSNLAFVVTGNSSNHEAAIGFEASHETFVAQMRRTGSNIQVDTSLEVAPSVGGFVQLLVVYFELHGQMRPGFFVLVSHRSRLLYNKILRVIKRRMTGKVAMRPAHVVTEPEEALMAAVTDSWPVTKVSCCLSHYYRAILRQLQERGLVMQFQETEAVRKWVGMLLAVPLLPANRLEDALELLGNDLPTHVDNTTREALRRLCVYATEEWLWKLGPEPLSVFGSPGLANRDADSFVRDLPDTASINIWTFVLALNKVISGVDSDIEQGAAARPRPNGMVLRPLLVRMAADLVSGRATVLTYLQAASGRLLASGILDTDQPVPVKVEPPMRLDAQQADSAELAGHSEAAKEPDAHEAMSEELDETTAAPAAGAVLLVGGVKQEKLEPLSPLSPLPPLPEDDGRMAADLVSGRATVLTYMQAAGGQLLASGTLDLDTDQPVLAKVEPPMRLDAQQAAAAELAVHSEAAREPDTHEAMSEELDEATAAPAAGAVLLVDGVKQEMLEPLSPLPQDDHDTGYAVEEDPLSLPPNGRPGAHRLASRQTDDASSGTPSGGVNQLPWRFQHSF